MNTIPIDLVERYSEPHRYYHTLKHISSMLREFDDSEFAILPGAEDIKLAIVYHDFFYDKEGNNEQRSAEYVLENFSNVTAANMILTTKYHRPISLFDAILCDLDLSILGQDWGTYLGYVAGVRIEYLFGFGISEEEFDKGRREFLQKFLLRDNIFTLPCFQQKYEAQARENIKREITSLTPLPEGVYL